MATETTQFNEATPLGPAGLRLADFLSAFSQPALFTGGHREVLGANARAEEVLGLCPQSIGSRLLDRLTCLSESDRQNLAASIGQRQPGGGEAAVPLRIQLGDGQVSATWTVQALASGPEGYLHLHRVYLHEEEQADPARVEFLANVSHELRTPLSALVATTEVMLQDYQTIPGPELGQMINLLHRNTRRLESLVSNLLDAAGLQNGKLQLRRSVTTVESLIRDASDFVLPLLSSKNQRLNTRVIGHPPALFVDPKRVVAVLVNLLSNASRYGQPNDTLQLIAAAEGTLVRFTVRQRGPGIPTHEQARLFQRFYRASTGEAVSGGSGLGLAIVKDIVEMHGGSVGLVSNPGKSTAFWFTLPLRGVVN